MTLVETRQACNAPSLRELEGDDNDVVRFEIHRYPKILFQQMEWSKNHSIEASQLPDVRIASNTPILICAMRQSRTASLDDRGGGVGNPPLTSLLSTSPTTLPLHTA